jgi:hypothetical protein
MQKIYIAEAKPSMTLAAAIKDKNGNIIFLKGLTLTEKHIQVLKNRDVLKVVVEGAPVKKEYREDFINEIDRRFGAAGPSQVISRIKNILKEILA